jgi:hypothetical protein
MSLLLLAIVGSIGSIVAMLFPIQTMKFFQRLARVTPPRSWGGTAKTTPYRVCAKAMVPVQHSG